MVCLKIYLVVNFAHQATQISLFHAQQIYISTNKLTLYLRWTLRCRGLEEKWLLNQEKGLLLLMNKTKKSRHQTLPKGVLSRAST